MNGMYERAEQSEHVLELRQAHKKSVGEIHHFLGQIRDAFYDQHMQRATKLISYHMGFMPFHGETLPYDESDDEQYYSLAFIGRANPGCTFLTDILSSPDMVVQISAYKMGERPGGTPLAEETFIINKHDKTITYSHFDHENGNHTRDLNPLNPKDKPIMDRLKKIEDTLADQVR
jgi:hypothetical protein